MFLNMTQPKAIALSIDEHTYSYQQLQAAVDEMSRVLGRLPNGVIALTALPGFDFIVQLLAALRNKQPVLILSATLTPEQIAERIQHIKNVLLVDRSGQLLRVNSASKAYSHHPDTALILFTSGSQGQSKAVQLSEVNIAANCRAVIRALHFSDAKDQLLFLPLCYSYGLLGQLMPALMSGIHTHLITDFSAISGFLMSGIVPQMWSGVPSHWVVLCKLFSSFPEACKKLTHVISAGDKLSLPMRRRLSEQFPNAVIYNNYGLTEASPRVLTLRSDDKAFFSEAAGYPVGDWQLKLTREGELCIKGSQMMLGYLGDPTQSKINNGWMHTGDLADIDANQLVTITGRADRTININGEKVNLDRIESLLKSTGLQLKALAHEDDIHGQRLVIAVEKNDSAHSRETLYDVINQAIQPWCHGFEIAMVERFPHNSRGKVDQCALEKMILTRRKYD